ncbi:unnamed protein product [Arabis nemorensis]|nr:unnamed protein product [Arabis nemorensis]
MTLFFSSSLLIAFLTEVDAISFVECSHLATNRIIIVFFSSPLPPAATVKEAEKKKPDGDNRALGELLGDRRDGDPNGDGDPKGDGGRSPEKLEEEARKAARTLLPRRFRCSTQG